MQFRTWPIVEAEHCKAVEDVVRSGHWHYGTVYRELEHDLDRIYGRHAVTTTSCAWAIYLILRSLPQLMRVAVPAYTYYGTVHPVIWAGARPVFVDVDPRTFNMCPDDLRRAVRDQRPDAVVAVHLHGLPFSTDIIEICREFSLPLIEDVCQAQGAAVGRLQTGQFGAAAAFSFNRRKTLPAGLGGAALFENARHALRGREIRDYGSRNDDNEPIEIGSYLPIGEFDAALARVQLDRLSAWLDHADAMAGILRDVLGDRGPYVPQGYTHAWHKFRIRGAPEQRSELAAKGVVTSTWMSRPLTSYPVYREYLTRDYYPGAEQVCRETFCLFDDEFPIVAQTRDTIEELAHVLQETLAIK